MTDSKNSSKGKEPESQVEDLRPLHLHEGSKTTSELDVEEPVVVQSDIKEEV